MEVEGRQCKISRGSKHLDYISGCYFVAPPVVTTRPESGPLHKYALMTIRELVCLVQSGYPKPELTWLFQNKTINKIDALHQDGSHERSRIFTIAFGEGFLSGTYSCIARNSEGQDRKDIQVKFVDVPDKNLSIESPMYVGHINQNITLRCSAGNIFNKNWFEILWYHKEIKESAKLSNSKLVYWKNVMESCLNIVNITRADAGQYWCKLRDLYSGSQIKYERRTTLVVEEPGLPYVTLNHYKISKPEGARVTLNCMGNHLQYDIAKLSWIKNGSVLSSNSQYSVSKQLTTNVKDNVQQVKRTLTINNLIIEDTGNFTCLLVSAVKNTSVSGYVSIGHQLPKTAESSHLPAWQLVMIVVTACCFVGLVTTVILHYMKRKIRPRRPSKGYGNFLYETFLTYSDEDYGWIKNKLIPLLEKYLVKYCMPHKDYEPGKALIENITDSVYQSQRVIAVVSKNYMSSKKCRDELDVALYRVAEKNDNSLIAIRVDSIDKSCLPKALRNRTFLDYTDKEEQKHWERRLLKQLFREYVEHETKPFLGT